MDQNGVKMALQGSPNGSPGSPKLVQGAARLLQKAPSGAKRFPEAPRWPQEAPKCPQDGPKIVSRGPQMEPDGARWEQNGDLKQCNPNDPLIRATWALMNQNGVQMGLQGSPSCSTGRPELTPGTSRLSQERPNGPNWAQRWP